MIPIYLIVFAVVMAVATIGLLIFLYVKWFSGSDNDFDIRHSMEEEEK